MCVCAVFTFVSSVTREGFSFESHKKIKIENRIDQFWRFPRHRCSVWKSFILLCVSLTKWSRLSNRVHWINMSESNVIFIWCHALIGRCPQVRIQNCRLFMCLHKLSMNAVVERAHPLNQLLLCVFAKNATPYSTLLIYQKISRRIASVALCKKCEMRRCNTFNRPHQRNKIASNFIVESLLSAGIRFYAMAFRCKSKRKRERAGREIWLHINFKDFDVRRDCQLPARVVKTIVSGNDCVRHKM